MSSSSPTETPPSPVEALLQNPSARTPAVVGVALRVCDHTTTAPARWGVRGSQLLWCRMCGAVALAEGADGRPIWARPELAKFVGRGSVDALFLLQHGLAEFRSACETLLGQSLSPDPKLAAAAIAVVGEHYATLLQAIHEIEASPVVRAADHLAGVDAILAAEERN